jgi:mycofactocin system creatininase family protein
VTATLVDLTWVEARDAANKTLVVPLGSTEQHGPHLPLSTDTDIAIALADAAAARDDSALVAPALSYGASGEHAGFSGTISIGHVALRFVLIELVRSASESFRRILFVSAHGGNAEALDSAIEQLRAEGHEVKAWSPEWSGDAHAGGAETSIMLALHTHRVQIDLAGAGARAPLKELMPVLRSQGVRAVTENGVLGDATGASAAEGLQLLAAATSDLCTHLDANW